MVNRVFCYSKEVAKKNGNKLPILQLMLSTVIFIIGIMITAIVFTGSFAVFMIMMTVFMILLVYYSVVLGLRLRTKMSGWATTNDGRIFKAMAINNGQGLYFSGIAAGSMIDQLAGNNNNIGENVGGVIGAAAQFYSMNRSAQYMSHPEIIAKMIEDAPNVSSAEVWEILKVYLITDGKHSVKINCDYRIIRLQKLNIIKI